MSDAAFPGQQRRSCFFIGIGGTGAKCAEALLHLSAAGLGPDRCTIMLVDQDQPNGNGERCLGVLDNYVQLRRHLRNPADTAPPAGAGLFRTEIVTPVGGATWCPSSRHGVTLAEICRYDRLPADQKALMDCLYLPEERDQKLDKGFRAHPSVGAAVMLSQTLEAEQFWQNVSNSIRAAREAMDVKIFLLGSIFGGTGAAGFPTIARLIRRAISERGNRNVDVGGALMLPYFTFPPPPHSTNGELLPDSSAFIEQTQGALGYYCRLLGEENLFDHLSLIGWQPLLEIGPYCEGGRPQNNPALIPELYAALATLNFFGANGNGGNRVAYFSTEQPRRVAWSDLPRVHTDGAHEVRHALGALLRFALAYHAVYRPALTRKSWRSVQREAWFRRLLGPDGVRLGEPAAQELLERTDEYCAELLRWAANISFGAAATDDVKLYQAAQFAHRVASDERFERADLKTLPEIDPRAFGALIDEEEGPDLPAVFDRLTYMRPAAAHPGIPGFLQALHQACRREP